MDLVRLDLAIYIVNYEISMRCLHSALLEDFITVFTFFIGLLGFVSLTYKCCIKMSIFWQNSNNLAKKCSTTPAGPVHSSPATLLDASWDGRTRTRGFLPEFFCWSGGEGLRSTDGIIFPNYILLGSSLDKKWN